MICVDNKIKNIYYMLCYSFNRDLLKEKQESFVSEEAFDNIYNLFSIILCIMLKKQVKKGIHKDYINKQEEIKTIRGKMNISDSVRNGSLRNKKIICQFDEFSENNLFNQIIKTTIFYLIKSNKIGKLTKNELKKFIIYFHRVDLIAIRSINWNIIKFNRFNNSYRNILLICRLILEGLIVTDKKGNKKFKEFLDDTRVSAIYENFLKAFFRKHYPDLNARSKKLSLFDDDENTEYIPIMKTDITLEYNDRMLIIDAKFYSKILMEPNYFGVKSKVINSNNIYQILAYVDNQDMYKKGNVCGMLLYAQTVNEPPLKQQKYLNGHKIFFRTLNLNAEWHNIENELNIIARCFIDDVF